MNRRRALAILSGAVAWPAVPRAADRIHRLAILSHTERIDRATGKQQPYWAAFFDELRRLGYDEQRNLTVTWHSTQTDARTADATADAVITQRPDVIFTPDARMATVLRAKANATPVVAITVDPVGSNVASSLARPGGNVTGFSIDPGPQSVSKRMELFRQAVPTASRMAWLTPRRTINLSVTNTTRKTAQIMGFTLVEAVLEAPIDTAAYHRAFAGMLAADVDTVWVATAGENLENRPLIADLAKDAKLPSMSGWRENVEAGGLMSYGNKVAATFRGCAGYIDRILKGANPAELPFQQPTKLELVINLSTARALGLTMPEPLLLQADEVIE